MSIKKLVAEEIISDEEETITFEKGHRYIYLIDPETGKYYQPKPGWTVTGEKLEDLFEEVPSA